MVNNINNQLINAFIDFFKCIDSINIVNNEISLKLKNNESIPPIKINISNIEKKNIKHIYNKTKPQEMICGFCKKSFTMTAQQYKDFLIQKEYGNVKFPFCCSECRDKYERVVSEELPTIKDLLK